MGFLHPCYVAIKVMHFVFCKKSPPSILPTATEYCCLKIRVVFFTKTLTATPRPKYATTFFFAFFSLW